LAKEAQADPHQVILCTLTKDVKVPSWSKENGARGACFE
jgi:hypothetical protein